MIKLKKVKRKKRGKIMGENQAREWRIKQRIEEPEEIDIPEFMKERQRNISREAEVAIDKNIKVRRPTNETKVYYMRNAETARDGNGSIRGDKFKKQSRFPKRRLLAIALAATIVFGTAVHNLSDDTPKEASTVAMEDAGITANELGLTPELVDELKELEAFFNNFDPETTFITEEEVVQRINQVDSLKDRVISSKLGNLYGVPAEEVGKGFYGHDSGGSLVCNIKVGDDIVLSNSLLPIFKREDISADLIELYGQFEKIESLSDKVLEDRITKSKAIKKLGEDFFEDLEIVANATFIKDKHNNLTVVYEEINRVNEDIQEQEKQEKEQDDEERM